MTTLLSLAALFAISADAQPGPAPAPVAEPGQSPASNLYIIRYRRGPAYRPGVALLRQDLREHGRYMQELARRGIMLAAGPTFAEEGGLVLLRADSLDEARAIMAADPAVRAGIFAGEVSDWTPFFDPGARFREPAAPPLP